MAIIIPPSAGALATLAASKIDNDEKYKGMRGVRVAVETCNGYSLAQFVAADNQSLGILTAACSTAPDWPTVANSPNGALEAVVPVRAIATSHGKDSRALVLGDAVATIATALGRFEYDHVEGEFPPIQEVVDRNAETFATITVDAKRLAKLLTIANRTTGASKVTLRVHARSVSIEADSAAAQFYGATYGDNQIG